MASLSLITSYVSSGVSSLVSTSVNSLSNWMYPSISDQKALINTFDEQSLACDPFYLVITLANITFLYQKLVTEQQAAQNLNPNNPLSPIEIKLNFTNGHLQVQEPGLKQKTQRTLFRETSAQLCKIRPHLIKFLQLIQDSQFSKEQKQIQTLLQNCQKGIKIIKQGYAHPNSTTLQIQQPISKNGREQKKEFSTLIIQTHDESTTFVNRILEDDIRLLTLAIQPRDDQQQQRFNQYIDAEADKYFSLRHFRLDNDQTIENFLAEATHKRWKNKTFQAIVRFFEPNPNLNLNQHQFNHYESIEKLIENIPPMHLELQKNIRDLFVVKISTTQILQNHKII